MAQSGNRDLAAAVARVSEAQARTRIERAALSPQVSASAQGVRSPTGISVQSVQGQLVSVGNSFDTNLHASYELDIWGLSRANLKASKELLKAAKFSQQSVALTITASVANNYFTVLALRERIRISREEILAINGILDTIKLRVETGKSSHLDLAQEEAQVESIEAQVAILEQQELVSRLAVAVLVGVPPEALEIEEHGLVAMNPKAAQPGVPSDLLTRRPDVAKAEADLAAAHANVDAARAAFLPQFSLAADGGFASPFISTLLRSSNFAYDFGAGLLQTIFDGGKLNGQKNLALATQRELIAAYQGTVLNAYADVEEALGQVTNYGNAESHLRREVEAAQEAFAIAELQYRQGTTDFITVLQAQQTLFSAKDQLAQSTLARLQANVHLYEALGGGWEEEPRDRTQQVAPERPEDHTTANTDSLLGH